MTLVGDGLRLAADFFEGTGREISRVALGPIWGSITTPDRVVLSDGSDGPRTISYEDVYRSQPNVAAVTNLIANQVTRLPMRVYEGDPDGDYEPVNGRHPLPTLLRKPAPRRGAAHLKRALILNVLLHGNSTFGKYRAGGPGTPPTELLKLDWPYMNAYARSGGPVELWTSRQADGEERPLAPEDVLHLCFEPPSGNLGVSPLEQLGTTVALEEAATRYFQSSFRNGVRPSGALTLPKDVKSSKEERAEMRADIERMHSGVDNAFRLALLTGGAEFQPFSFNAAEAALIEAREVNREETFMAYGMPPVLAGDFRRATLSNVTETNRALFTIFLNPYLEIIQDALQVQLIDDEPEWAGMFVRFDLSEVLKGDPVAEATAQAGLVREGVIARDEARTRLGLKRKGGAAGELTYNANNQQAVSALPAGPPAAPKPSATEVPPTT